jgi:hypothetical protein
MRIGLHITRGVAAGSIATLAAVVGGLGVATAANGGSLMIGHRNSATKTTTLTDRKGTPLTLVGKKSKPPLKVNSSKLVKKLNSAEVGGLTSGELSTGSAAQHLLDVSKVINATVTGLKLPVGESSGSATTSFPISAVETAPLPAGTYFATATAVGVATNGALCFLGTSEDFPAGAHAYGTIGDAGNLAEATESQSFVVLKGQRIHEWCVNTDTTSTDGPAIVVGYTINAVRIANPHPGTATPTNFTVSRRTAARNLLRK